MFVILQPLGKNLAIHNKSSLPAFGKNLCACHEAKAYPDEGNLALQAFIHPGLHGPAPQQPLQHHGGRILLHLTRLSRQQ